MVDKEQIELIHDLLAGAVPVNPQNAQFVSREEFLATVRTIESKIENAALRQKQWVLTGCLAILVSFGGGYISLVNKLDRLSEALPAIEKVSQERQPWMLRQEQRDTMQDEVLRKLDKTYAPMPYQPPPE